MRDPRIVWGFVAQNFRNCIPVGPRVNLCRVGAVLVLEPLSQQLVDIVMWLFPELASGGARVPLYRQVLPDR